MKKHYVQQFFDKLYKATDWLAGQYGFDKTEQPTTEKKQCKERKGRGVV